MTVLPTAFLLLAAVAAPRAAVVVHATGFPDVEVQRLEDKIGAEVSATGADLWALSKALEVKAECLENRGCAREVLRAADAGFLLWVELLRAGPQVQVSARLLDGEGRVLAEVDSGARVESVLGPSPLVPADVLVPLKSAVPQTTTTPPHPAAGGGPTKGGETTTASPASSPASDATGGTDAAAEPLAPEEQPDEVEAPPLSPLAVGGIAALGVGTLLTLGSAAVIPGQLGIINDPKSLGPEKEAAANAVATAGILATVGALTAIGGGALLYLGLES